MRYVRKFAGIFSCWILFLGISGLSSFGDSALAGRLDEIISRFPAENTQIRNQLAAAIFELGKKGIKQICIRIKSPEEGGDVAERYALSGLAAYAGRLERENERRIFVDAVSDSLKNHPEPKAKPFLIRMLQLTGRRDAVKSLRRCLRVPELCRPAARALRIIGTGDAEKSLLKALNSAPLSCSAALIQHLGELRSQKAVKKIIPFASSSHPEIKQAALFALANSGSPEAEEILLKSPVLAPPEERKKAPSLLLLYSRRLAEEGRKKTALSFAEKILNNYQNPGEISHAAAALELIVEIQGPEAVSKLMQIMKNPNPELRHQAYRLADCIPGEEVSKMWIERAEISPPVIQAEILTMLGKRGDRPSRKYIHEKLKSNLPRIRESALRAAAFTADEKILPVLIHLLFTASEKELPLISRVLLRMPAEAAVSAASEVFMDVSPEARISLLEVLSARRARGYSRLAFSQVESRSESLRKASLASLENLVTASDIHRVIKLLFQLEDRQEVSLVQKALIAGAHQIPDEENRAEPVLSALEKAEGEKRIDFLRTLSGIGGEKALNTVWAFYSDENFKMKTAAVYTLSEWPDFRAADKLEKIARHTTADKFRYLALQGYIRVVTESEQSPGWKEDQIKRVRDLPENDPEAKIILSGLSRIKSRGALKMAEKFYLRPGLEKETAWTVIQIILPQPEKEGMTGKDLIPVLKKTLGYIENDYDRERILQYIEKLQSPRAKVTARTSRAPEFNNVRLHSSRVAPVVKTSSTSRTVFPFSFSGFFTEKTPRILRCLSLAFRLV